MYLIAKITGPKIVRRVLQQFRWKRTVEMKNSGVLLLLFLRGSIEIASFAYFDKFKLYDYNRYNEFMQRKQQISPGLADNEENFQWLVSCTFIAAESRRNVWVSA